MRRLCIGAALLLVLTILSACRQTEPPPASERSLSVELEVQPQPPATGDSTLLVTVRDSEGSPVEDARVAARGDMSHAGMVPVIAEGQGGEDGVYTVPFEWTMTGDWFVDVTVTLNNGDEVQQRFDVTVEGAMAHNEMMTAEETLDDVDG